ncbi:DUF4286 family protein [Telmatospirillum sp. J64-1]|uniref:DUF4286 family protein n=1 Tax=Telmatospirillum sp. J64-1 TaxID=2502183 RepID=UPI00115CE030|nr:DUF4286 family protein [Telmatospirillum sp. J64-1]
MAFLGQGVLAIWNGVQQGNEDAFLDWHVNEHIPERVGLPGFLRARRYTAVKAHPAFFNFYEVADPAVLVSKPYLDRLNDPTDWTKRVVSTFTDTSRTLCQVALSDSRGVGSHVAVLRCDIRVSGDDQGLREAVQRLRAGQGICGVHLLYEEKPATPITTSENKLRDRPDATWPVVLIVEALSAEAAQGVLDTALAGLVRAGLPEPAARDVYALQYLLDEGDLE